MYIVVKTVKGRRYRYLQRSWREGKRVRTKSICLGALHAVCGLIEANRTRRHGFDEEEALRQHNELCARENAARQATLDKLHADFGLKLGPDNPTPVDAPEARESPTAEVGQADAPSEQSE